MVSIKKTEKGFSALEVLLVLIIIGLVGFVGWFVLQSKNKSNKDQVGTQTTMQQTQTKTAPEKKVTPYTFKELGISMDVQPGWDIKAEKTQQEGVNFYTWTVSKTGADGKISVNSTGFRGGFENCNLTPATIKEVMPTHNPALMFLSWSYVYDNKTNYRTGIAKTDEAIFKTINSETVASIKNEALKPGNYYFCLGYPAPGFSLGLSTEAAPGFSRNDTVKAFPSISSTTETNYAELAPTAKSYAEIKTMLTSIK